MSHDRMTHRSTEATDVPISIAQAAPASSWLGTKAKAIPNVTHNVTKSAVRFSEGRSMAHKPVPAMTPTLLA